MSPQVTHTLFLICAASVAALLLVAGGTINSIAAIAVAGGAQPLYKATIHAMIDQGLDDAESALVAERERRDRLADRGVEDRRVIRE
jgi:hypothetical protein